MMFGISRAKNADMIQRNQQRKVNQNAGNVEITSTEIMVKEH